VLELRTFDFPKWNFLISSQKPFRASHAPPFVSDMLRSCGAGPLGVNTCCHVWEESLNAGKLEGGSVETIKIALRRAHDPGLGRDRGSLRDIRIYVLVQVGAIRLTTARPPNGEDITAT
jgi:hypothetical protein